MKSVRSLPIDIIFHLYQSLITIPLNLQIKVPIEVIEQKANEYFQETLLHDEQGGNMIDLKVTKTAPIKVIGQGGYLQLTAKLHVWAKMKLKKQLLGVFDVYTPQVDKTEFDIEVEYHLQSRMKKSSYPVRNRTMLRRRLIDLEE